MRLGLKPISLLVASMIASTAHASPSNGLPGVWGGPGDFGVGYSTIRGIAQSKSMSCWAAAAAMMLSWKSGVPVTELQAASNGGTSALAAYQNNTGLTGPEISDFVSKLGMRVEQPQNLSAAGFKSLLSQYGPLWVGTAITQQGVQYRHVRIVRGYYLQTGSNDGTMLQIVDPDGDREYLESVTDFAKEMETVARQDLGAGNDLTPQIIHF